MADDGFENVYADAEYAGAYARLDWTGTYFLIRRDLPDILRKHVEGRRALDFGCGTGRSTRLLRSLGFEAMGVDIAESMIARARAIDATGDYRLIREGDLSGLPACDLVLAAFPFDNIPGSATKIAILRSLRRLLSATGVIVNVVSSPEIYSHEWASFSTKDFPENRFARSGDVVRIVTAGFPGARPCEDVLFTDESYREVYANAGLEVAAVHRPLGRAGEPVQWVNETRIAPWAIYVLRPTNRRPMLLANAPRVPHHTDGPVDDVWKLLKALDDPRIADNGIVIYRRGVSSLDPIGHAAGRWLPDTADMRISADEYRALPLIAHMVLEGVPLRDVSAIDLPDGGNRSIADVFSLLSGSEASGGIASALMRVRETVGRWLHWDDATPAAPSRFWDQVPADLRRPPEATDSGAFRLMYRRPDEALSEIRNATVHAFLCTVLRRRPDGYRLYWAVYVLPVSWFTPVYMAVIEPFRRFLVYPSLLRRLRREWVRRYAANPRS